MHDMAMHGDCAQGRPKDGPEDKFRLNPVVPRLQELLGGAKVDFCHVLLHKKQLHSYIASEAHYYLPKWDKALTPLQRPC